MLPDASDKQVRREVFSNSITMNSKVSLNPNPVVAAIGKEPRDFTKADIIDFVKNNGITMINFMYPAADGRLKTLNFVITSELYLDTILSVGERVDGSSLFPYIEASGSDLYVVPRFRTAFIDPFAPQPTLTMLCSYFDKDGKPLESAPEYMLQKACRTLHERTGLDFEAMGELEYYVIAEDECVYPATDQRGYHETAPFAKHNEFRMECMMAIARTGGKIKYGHSEVGNFTLDGRNYEQNEIEFVPVPAEEAAEQLLIAKWIIRTMAHRRGLRVTFAPKITAGKAGSGLHIHMRLMRDGRSVMVDENKRLSTTARRAIAGVIDLAPSITAFGNPIPTSYFRLVPHQEAPTNVCWGDRNRSVLVRVPLGWTADSDMCAAVNPGSRNDSVDTRDKQTVEIRSADGSANVYSLLSALAVALRHGLEMPDADEVAERTYVDVDIHKSENADRCSKLAQLPTCCEESADRLIDQRGIYEQYGVFSPGMIDSTASSLRAFADHDLASRCAGDQSLADEIVARHFHCG